MELKKQELCDTLQKYVEDKYPNVTNEEINKKIVRFSAYSEVACSGY